MSIDEFDIVDKLIENAEVKKGTSFFTEDRSIKIIDDNEQDIINTNRVRNHSRKNRDVSISNNTMTSVKTKIDKEKVVDVDDMSFADFLLYYGGSDDYDE